MNYTALVQWQRHSHLPNAYLTGLSLDRPDPTFLKAINMNDRHLGIQKNGSDMRVQ
eukprot:CAMPEP_0184403650 /NCGR_PEP_ID=MMETSP0007-20130409/85529_1 /TAXON_ID=97485 /ORGANISM="Prymnesium parvum, Strain Texoma1" /LENGTH=55 /DNA_ID=CAMNT_0026759771 /DNA_START=259 /DNA_END=426 /DNA_ORIENTATION=+